MSTMDLYGYAPVIRVGVHADTGDADDVADMTAGEDPGLDDRTG